MSILQSNHLGKMVMDGLMANPDYVCQVDAATGEVMSNADALSKSIRLAKCLRSLMLEPGDVLIFSGRNHIDVYLPFYVGLFNGHPITGVDPQFKYSELKNLFKIIKPKIAFCEPESYDDYCRAMKDLGLNAKIVTYGHGDTTLNSFMEEYTDDEPETDFKVVDYDTEKVYPFLICSSGTISGKIKVAAVRHSVMAKKLTDYIIRDYSEIRAKSKNEMYLSLSPVNWMTSYLFALSLPITNYCMLTSSKADDIDHVIDIINKYRPIAMIMGPAFVASLASRLDEVDLTCLRDIGVGGSKCQPANIEKIQSRLKENVYMHNFYGLTETLGTIFKTFRNKYESCGQPSEFYELKLVDPDSGIEIKEANITGELWVKGLTFTEYYNDPKETANCITSDGFVKTGDLLYRDEQGFYYYVERMKALIKYRNYHVIPSEIEDVIRLCPGVKDVCVVGISDDVDIEVPVACVVRQEGASVSAKEIKELVSSKLSTIKHLRGGVVFINEMPLTTTQKISRTKLMTIVSESIRE